MLLHVKGSEPCSEPYLGFVLERPRWTYAKLNEGMRQKLSSGSVKDDQGSISLLLFTTVIITVVYMSLACIHQQF